MKSNPMDGPRICLLGKFQLQGKHQVIGGFKSKKVQELFCYLLIHREHPQPRESLANLFWGDHSTENSKKYLRQALWMLQSTLNETLGAEASSLLRAEAEWVHVDAQACYWLDVAIFEETYQKIYDQPVMALTEQNVQDLNLAVDLYRGDLMDGCYLDWCLFERERLQGIYQKMLHILTGYYEIHQEYENGLIYARRILSFDHASERTHRLMMRLYYFSGNRTQALRQYKACEEALQAELDVCPSQKTIALYEQIRADTLPAPERLQRRAEDTVRAVPLSLANTLQHMQHFQQTLNEIQSRLQNEIQAIEKVLETT